VEYAELCGGRLMAGFEFGDLTLQTAPDVDIFFCAMDVGLSDEVSQKKWRQRD